MSHLTLALESVATLIRWERGAAEVVFSRPGGTRIVSARAVVIAIPPASLRKLSFAPALHEKRAALERIQAGEVVKVIVRFKEDFWSPRLRRDLSFLHSAADPYFPTWWTPAPFQWPFLTGWAGGVRARRLSGLSPGDLRVVAAESLSRLFGLSLRSVLGLMEALHSHDWQSDPDSAGAYSYLTVGGLDASAKLALPVEDTLFFAGEASEESGINGTVDAAIRSGLRAAEQVRASMSVGYRAA